VQRNLASFVANGLMLRDQNGHYQLSLACYRLGQLAQATHPQHHLAPSAMANLAEQSGETAFLCLLDGQRGICVQTAPSPHALRFSIRSGEHFSLLAGAHAKAMLAFQPKTMRLQLYRQAARTDITTLENEMADIRQRGWCQTSGEAASDISGLALPLHAAGSTNAVFGSLALAGPSTRLLQKDQAGLLACLHDTRHAIAALPLDTAAR
jgi:DNA-binding IclR family transcriptional regulator